MGEIKKGVLKKMQNFLCCSEAMISFSRSETQHFLILGEEKIIFDRQIKNGKNPQKNCLLQTIHHFSIKKHKNDKQCQNPVRRKMSFQKNYFPSNSLAIKCFSAVFFSSKP